MTTHRLSLAIAPLVWLAWYFLPEEPPFAALLENWRITLTMAFGSFIAGATAESGGAVAFPVFTKVLAIPARDAKLFSLATQSIGMGSAFLTILLLRVQVEWRAVLWVVLGALTVFPLGLSLAETAPSGAVRIFFTVVQCSFALALWWYNRDPAKSRHPALPRYGLPEKAILLAAGMVGGFVTGLLGSGLDIIAFTVLVLLFRMCEKVSTPTTVVMMALMSWAGFATIFAAGKFTAPVTGYWLAAIPIVVVGAPLGVYACSKMQRMTVVRVLLFLIATEFVSSLLLIPLDRVTAAAAVLLFLAFTGFYHAMARSTRYL